MKQANRLALLVLLSIALVCARTESQTASTQTQDVLHSDQVLRANTRLVVVDVVATDGKGQLLGDLKPGDLTMLEDGKIQKISNFTFHPPGKTDVVLNSHLPANVVTNAPSFQASSLNVLLLDTLNGDFAEQAYVKDQLLKYLSRAQFTRPIAIFALEDRLVLLHDFTTDAAVLKSAVEKFKPPARNNNAETVQSRASAFSTHGDFHTNERDIATTLNQLNALAKTLAGYPGRKNLIWLSESFPINLFPDSMANGASGICSGDACGITGGRANGTSLGSQAGSPTNLGRSSLEGNGEGSYKDYALLIKKVSDSLMKAQVAVYAVDAGAVGKDERIASHVTMNDMADRTGGRAFINTNDLAASMSSSVDDGSTYYTLEYYPDNKKWDGLFRSIQVRSSRPGVNLRYRAGYYALDPEKVNKEDSDAVAESFSRALQVDAPAATQIVFQAHVQPPSDKNKKVVVALHIDPRTLAFEHKDGGMEFARLSCTVWAYGKDKDKPIMSNGTVSANLKASEYQQMLQQQFLSCERQLELKPGTYALRMGVLDRATNKIGTASAQVVVP
ncbi:MAG TPA: VWA domain-containing protein [Candidatus Polarisedimenticolia bacterium]|jgi:VWFA-related protein|nr:VWA domain-containing protein [Candidatus Polarisedimenticolia bacterium]